MQLNRPTSFASSSTSELNGFVDNRPSVYTTSVNHADSDRDLDQDSSQSLDKELILQVPRKENQIPATSSKSAAHSAPAAPVSSELSETSVTRNSTIDSGKSSENAFSVNNKEIELLKNRRVSLCVPSAAAAESDNHSLENRRASSPFTNGGTELLIGPPPEEHRLKTTAIIEDSRRSSKDYTRWVLCVFIYGWRQRGGAGGGRVRKVLLKRSRTMWKPINCNSLEYPKSSYLFRIFMKIRTEQKNQKGNRLRARIEKE